MRLLTIGSALAVLFASLSAATASVGSRHTFSLDDPERDCAEYVPAAYTLAPVTGETLEDRRVKVLLLLDGVTRKEAKPVTEVASELYAVLGVQLTYQRRAVTFKGDAPNPDGEPAASVGKMMSQLQGEVGGQSPEGVDVVHLLTEKRLFIYRDADSDREADESERTYGVAGVAMCIGGVRWDETSFSLSGAPDEEGHWTAEDAGHTLAHELGHLFGARHESANCVEGTARGPEDGRIEACTVMFAASYGRGPVHTAAEVWSRAEAAIIRGHVETYTGS